MCHVSTIYLNNKIKEFLIFTIKKIKELKTTSIIICALHVGSAFIIFLV